MMINTQKKRTSDGSTSGMIIKKQKKKKNNGISNIAKCDSHEVWISFGVPWVHVDLKNEIRKWDDQCTLTMAI